MVSAAECRWIGQWQLVTVVRRSLQIFLIYSAGQLSQSVLYVNFNLSLSLSNLLSLVGCTRYCIQFIRPEKSVALLHNMNFKGNWHLCDKNALGLHWDRFRVAFCWALSLQSPRCCLLGVVGEFVTRWSMYAPFFTRTQSPMNRPRRPVFHRTNGVSSRRISYGFLCRWRALCPLVILFVYE